MMTRKIFILLPAFLSLCLAGCSPVGMATGAGAAVGIAATKEGGIRGAASDLAIRAKINDLWFKYDLKTFAQLNLKIDQGRVLITGVVQDPEDRVEAVRLVWQVEGVKQVINEIQIAESEGFPGLVRDKWITTRLRTALTFDKQVQSINYSIETVQGTVYLMGVAQSGAELDRVMEVARTVPHVRQVISYVKPAGEAVGDAPLIAAPTSSVTSAAPTDDMMVEPVSSPAIEPVQRETISPVP